MEQSRIWQYFQIAHPESFSGAATRLHYLATRLPPNSLVINIGVGSGQFERLAHKRGHRVLSLDPDVRSLHAAHAEYDIVSVAAVIDHLPFRDQSVDVVVVSEVIEHLNDTTLAVGLSDIRRILKPGGTLLGTVPFNENLQAAEVVCPHCGAVFHKVGHVQTFSASTLADLLRPYFQDVSVRRFAFMNTSDLRPVRRLFAWVRNYLVLLGILTRDTSLVFQARKHGA